MSHPIVVRPAGEDDAAFIENAWASTMRALCLAAQGSEPGHFHGEMRRVFARLLPTATVRVACSAQDPATLVGFIAATGPELHYAYVAHDFRKMGVVPLMLEGLPIKRFTFSTSPGVRRLKPQERGWVYTPRWTL